MSFFERICIALILGVCVLILFQNNLFYLLLSLESFSLLYSFLIGSGGSIRKAVLYASFSFAIATSMAVLVPHDFSFSEDNFDFLRVHRSEGEIFVGLLFLFSVGFIMPPLIGGIYVPSAPLILPFIGSLMSGMTLFVIAQITIGYSWLLFVSSVFTLLCAFYRMLLKEGISKLFLTHQLFHMGLLGLMLCYSGNTLHYCIFISVIYQIVFSLIFSILLREGIDDSHCLQRLRVSSKKSYFLFLVAILSPLILSTIFIFYINSLAEQDFGFELKLVMFLLSSLVGFAVHYFCRSMRSSTTNTHITFVETFCVCCLCSYFLFAFFSVVYDQHQKFMLIISLLSVGVVYFLFLRYLLNFFSQLRVLFCYTLHSLKKLILEAKKFLFCQLGSLLDSLLTATSSMFIFVLSALESLSLSFAILLMSIFIVLFLSIGV